MAHYERLSGIDAAFLEIETPNCHMHAGAALIFDAEPLQLSHGGIDIDRIRDYVQRAVEHVPRCRQRVDQAPLQRHPVWVDDERFNLHYHVRHTALPRPGSERQLKRLIGRVASQPLDRGRPLWELWVVEGLEGNRFALLAKVHHCMMDGIAGIGAMQLLLRPEPTDTDVAPPPAWKARPTPSRSELLSDELRRSTDRVRALWRGIAKMRDDPQAAIDGALSAANEVLTAVGHGLTPASHTPLNPRNIGSYRRFDWLRLELQAARDIRAKLGGTINDVVLATMAGALRRYFSRREVDTSTLDYRILVPVSRRKGSGKTEQAGNRISMMLVRLPLAESDPLRRFDALREETRQSKRSGQHEAAERLGNFGNWAAPALVGQGMKLVSLIRPYNLVVTNVPGPQHPLYMLGSQLREAYMIVPLYLNQALGVALFSYDGGLFWGLNADWDQMPDLHEMCSDIEQAFAELKAVERPPLAAHSPEHPRQTTLDA